VLHLLAHLQWPVHLHLDWHSVLQHLQEQLQLLQQLLQLLLQYPLQLQV